MSAVDIDAAYLLHMAHVQFTTMTMTFVLQAQGCGEAGAAPAEQPQRLSLSPLSPAGPDAQAQ